MNKTIEDVSQRSRWPEILALIIAVAALIIGEGIYQQSTGNSVFDLFHPTPTKMVGTYNFSVPSNVLWYDTGIRIQSGQILSIRASGTISTLDNPNDPLSSSNDPNGQDSPCPAKNNPDVSNMQCPMNGQPYGALIAKIGDNAPFRVGISFGTMTSNSGNLYLVINDNYPYYDDNTGYFEVSVTLK